MGDLYANNLDFRAVVVAQTASQSAEIDLNDGERCLGFICPAAIEATTAELTFQASKSKGGTFTSVTRDGTAKALTFAVNDYALFDNVLSLYGVKFFKITCATTGGVAVAQATALRTFYAIIERF